ncbi:phage tail tape measure C-terminal domain-containing protein [Paracoccus onubensis]|uniref:Bacteriophage tail tape measure C-terminal domain-containing protein n=1 Tax=Paracoccus onubensis TaxID=1675788 RepID=A0A418T1R7_9RHOB|nr:phage tail tape measure C-terminal domain-containing protein [Paracoccus onubensis]RJE87138.1 hypothetical protein D3P04_05150 [Paracoccus onubensis]
MTADMRAQLTVTADASSLAAEMRRGSEGLREMRRETEAAAKAAEFAASEQGRMVQQLNQTFSSFGAGSKSARDSFGVFEASREYEAFQQEQAQQAARAYQALENSIDPLIRAERELAQQQEIVNRALQQGQITNTQSDRTLQQLEQRYRSFVAAHNPAVQSARAMEQAFEAEERAVRQLTLAVDPAARAADEMKRAQDQLNRAVRLNIITQEEATRVAGLLGERQQAVGRFSGAMGMGIQNVSFQLTDFIVQVQSGQSATVALTQQLPQLLGGFGAIGAALGLAAALAVPATAAIFGLGANSEDAGKQVDRLSSALQDFNRFTDQAGKSTALLEQDFGSFAGRMKEIADFMTEVAVSDALNALESPDFNISAQIKDAADAFDDFAAARERYEQTQRDSAAGAFGIGPEQVLLAKEAMDLFRLGAEEAAAPLDLLPEQAKELHSSIEALKNSDGMTAFRDNADEALKALQTMTAESGQMSGPIVEAAKKLEEVVNLSAKGTTAEERRVEIAEELRNSYLQEAELARAINRHGEDSIAVALLKRDAHLESVNALLSERSITGEVADEIRRAATEAYDLEEGIGVAERAASALQSVIGGTSFGDLIAGADTLSGKISGLVNQASALWNTLGQLGSRQITANQQADLLRTEREMIEAGKSRVAIEGELAVMRERQARVNDGLTNPALRNAGLDQVRETAEQAARDRAAITEMNRQAARAASGGRGGGRGRNRSGTAAGASIINELARLQPTLENDIAAADAWREKALENLNRTKTGFAEFADDVERVYQEKLREAYEDDLKRRDDWAAGVERGLLQVEDELGSWADTAENLVTGWAEGAEDAFVKFGQTGKASIGDLVDFALEQFLRLAFQQNIAPGLNTLLDSAVSWIGGFLPGGSGAAPSISTNHTGSPGVMRSYALGGYGDRMRQDERLAMIRDGEEIMTSRALENAGALISNLSAIASQPSSPTIIAPQSSGINLIVNDYSKDGFSAEESTDNRGNPTLTMTLGRQVGSVIRQSGNPAGKAIESKYNVRKRGIAR